MLGYCLAELNFIHFSQSGHGKDRTIARISAGDGKGKR